MNKEEILEKSRKENEGKVDEYEKAMQNSASKVGMAVGCVICALLFFISEVLLERPEIAFTAYILYFAMMGSHNITMFVGMKKRYNLIVGVLEVVFAVAFCVALGFYLFGGAGK